jgi:CheY-specific phosphatase CheX
MPEVDLAGTLAKSVDEVLETMFFTVALGAIDGSVLEGQDVVGACVAFEGMPSGSLSVLVTSAAARTIAADFLGIDAPDVDAQQTNEVVCEMANMICGSVVSALESGRLFRLSSPRVLNSYDPDTRSKAESVCAIELADGAMIVAMTTGVPECQTTEKFAS